MTAENGVEELLNQTANYVATMLSIIDHIKTVKKPEDRLGYASELSFCLNGMLLSIKGWGAWLNNIAMLSTLDIEDLKAIYESVKEISTTFLTIDLEITKKKLDETKIKIEKLQSGSSLTKKDKEKEKTYVS